MVALEQHQHVSKYCKDNDLAMHLVTGMTCKNVKSQGHCMLIHRHLFPDVCKCSCPEGAGAARRQAQSMNSLIDKDGCSIDSFAPKLRALGKMCCDPNDPDDKCNTDGVPLSCDYECAKELPNFFPVLCQR